MSLSWKTTSPTLVLIGRNPEPARIAIEAMQSAFAGAVAITAENLDEAAQAIGRSPNTLLVLFAPTEAEVAAAAAALDPFGLPRWGIVVWGEVPDSCGVISIPAANWQVGEVARTFKLALALHRTKRENARFRGDLATFGTRVAHDLRSPLGGVLTTVDVLKEILGEEAPSRVALLEPILESTDGLTKLIRQLSYFARAAAGENPKISFNMGVAFWTAWQRVEREALSLGATINQPATWPDVEGDPAWVESIWHVFLCNALQHSGPKPRIAAGWSAGVGETRFWLKDRGEVPPGKRATLFQPFHLLHHPNAPRGFGLPIAGRLAALQDGNCGYEPMPEGGSCFFFTLPAKDKS